ncbi:MAG: IS3 family transposase, partial [Candidatus Eremiobacteraeota bacterium]|nr:IS3 family transposase [Candidatus Eremiobacteraeota bacterium]
MDKVGLSQTKACAVATCNRKTFRRVLRRPDDGPLLERLRELAAERRRFGYRRLDIFLRRDGIVANHKRIYRVYAEANLQVRKRLKRRVALGRGDVPPAI